MSYTNQQLAHAWSHQQTTDAKNNGGSMFIVDQTIFSYGYHFPMAKHCKNGLVLITNQTYSVTTGGHLGDVRYACNHLKTMFVHNVEASTKDQHKQNYKKMIESSEALKKQASTARGRKESLLNSAASEIENANEYSKIFKLGYKQKTLNIDNLDEIKEKVKKDQAKKLKAEKLRIKKLEKENSQKITDWRNGSNVRLPYNLPVKLRVADGRVESNKGVNFPVEHAPLAWAMLKRCTNNKTNWKANGHTIKLGHYQVSSISSTGTLIAGCHTVPFEESQYIATLLEL